jgi:hypothetical protein
MTSPQRDAPDVGESTDITADPADLETRPEDRPATSTAEEFREDGTTLGGTGGMDAGGAG